MDTIINELNMEIAVIKNNVKNIEQGKITLSNDEKEVLKEKLKEITRIINNVNTHIYNKCYVKMIQR